MLCGVANKPFAVLYLAERIHVVSSKSIAALVDITAHPFFGPYVKSVLLSGARRRSVESLEGPGILPTEEKAGDEYVSPTQLDQLMGQVFTNIKGYGNTVTLGVVDHPSVKVHPSCLLPFFPCFEWKEHFKIRHPRLILRTVETFTALVTTAERVGCPIDGVKTFQSVTLSAELSDAIRKFLATRNTPLATTQFYRYSIASESKMVYKPQEELWKIVGFEVGNHLFSKDFLAPPVDAHVSQLILEKCKIDMAIMNAFILFTTSAVESITLESSKLITVGWEINVWSKFLELLSNLPDLEHFSIRNAIYDLSLAIDDIPENDEDEDGDANETITPGLWLPNGLYPSNIEEFRLSFPSKEGSYTNEVRAEGPNVCTKLRGLAAYAAAAEAKKIRDIEKRGRVLDDEDTVFI